MKVETAVPKSSVYQDALERAGEGGERVESCRKAEPLVSCALLKEFCSLLTDIYAA